MSAKEYVERVVHGDLGDRVLGSQLRAGFVVRGLLRNYLHDWRSRNWATLLEWENPDFAYTAPAETGLSVLARPMPPPRSDG